MSPKQRFVLPAGCCLLVTLWAAGNRPLSSQELPVQKLETAQSPSKTKLPAEKDKDAAGWRSLLPKDGLEGWQTTDFGSQGQVRRDGDLLILEMGDPLTGVNRKKLEDFPREDYEIELECKRIEGSDFLCGLTFPVADEFCSFIAGGWGGGLVGLSSINGMDASENSTSSYFDFKNGTWYKFRVRVDASTVRAWINDKELIRQERDHSEFSTRIEVYPSQPLGLCAFQSKVAVRNFRWRPYTADSEAAEKKDTAKEDTAKKDTAKKDTPR